MNKALTSAVVCSGSSQGSSKAGFPWWAGLIIALVALALILAVAGLACLGHRRRRRRRNASLEEAIHKQVIVMPCWFLLKLASTFGVKLDCHVLFAIHRRVADAFTESLQPESKSTLKELKPSLVQNAVLYR